MRRQIAISVFVFTFVAVLVMSRPVVKAQTAPAKEMTKDEVFFGIAQRVNAASESPVSAVVGEIDSLIEITGIAMEKDGKALVTIKERSVASAPRSIRLKFAPPASSKQWDWQEFEDNRKFYPVDKLFPYAKDELGRRHQLAGSKWGAVVSSIEKQVAAAASVLETAKAVLKTDPPPLAPFTGVRNAFVQAMKDNDREGILAGYRDLSQQSDAILTLGDTYAELKTNDAYLRLIEEYKKAVNATNIARKEYVQSVDQYNESILRLPFALVAYGLQFTKIESALTAE